MSGEDLWFRIDPNEINAALSSEYLWVLEPLLERDSEIPIVDDKIEKAQIYKMTVLSKLHSNQFRKKIFSYLTKEELREISHDIGLPTQSKSEMIKNLLQIPWDNNSKAYKIAEFIGIPTFMLEITSISSEYIPDKVYPWITKYKNFLKTIEEEKLEAEFANRTQFKTLKSYQAIAQQDVLEKLSVNFEKCILNMPTGTGKTRTAMEIVCSFLLEEKDYSVVWVADTRELLDQAALEFSQIWEFLGDREIDIIRRYGGKSNTISNESSFIVTSFQTLLKNMSDLSDVDVSLIVIDEAHKSVAKKWNEVIISLIKPHCATKILGLTATPIRGDSNESKKLKEFFGNNLIPLKYDSNKNIIDYLIENEILAMFKCDIIDGEKLSLSIKQLKKIVEENSDFPIEFLKKLSKDGPRNLAITRKLKEILGKPEDKQQILFFGLNIDHSKMIATWLIKNGYSAFHLDNNVDALSRKSCIDAFRSGKLRVLCNYGVLATGFDAPKLDCVFIARPTTSHVLHSQMVGRGLRGPKLGGTPTCLIVEVEDNIENFESDLKVSFEKHIESWK